uniref:Uncharacterized protein n=1 Tax=Moniliophthora roreri TaxID=221103 RepID=A0A0W0FLA6_MONRR
MLAQHITDNENFTVTGAIAVPRPSLDIANLPLHVILPDTNPDRDRFATDEDVSPNDPAFLRKVITHQKGLRRATEISKGQFLLNLRQRCVGVVQTPVPSSSIPQTHATIRIDASAVYLPTSEPFSTLIHSPLSTTQEVTNRTSPTPVEELENSQMSPLLLPCPQCLPAMNSPPPLPVQLSPPEECSSQQDFLQTSRTPYNSLPPLFPSTQTPNVPIVSVWDDEDAELDDRALPIDSTSSNPITHTTALLDEVHQELSVLCANWESTAPLTVWTISAQFATLIKLAISLDIVGTEDSLQELWDETILAAHQLLTLIGEMIPRGTMPTMEMESNERPQDLPLGDRIVMDMGSPKGPRIFRRIDRETEMREPKEPQWQGEWLIGGQPIALNM